MYIVVRTVGKHTMGYGCVSVLECVIHVHVCSVYANVSSEIAVPVLEQANSDTGLECWYSYKEKRDVVYVMAI